MLPSGDHRHVHTDHNCARANTVARALAGAKGIRYISGIEIDCIYKGLGFHVLGYGIDERSADFAHPGVNLKGREGLLGEVLDLGMDGVEAFSSYHTPEQAVKFYRQARERGLSVTCGSDYHGKTKPAIRLGGYGKLPSDFTLGQLNSLLDMQD